MKIFLTVAACLLAFQLTASDGNCGNFSDDTDLHITHTKDYKFSGNNEEFSSAMNYTYGNPENSTLITDKNWNIPQIDLSFISDFFLLTNKSQTFLHPNSKTQHALTSTAAMAAAMKLDNVFTTDEPKIFFDPTLEVPLGKNNVNIFGGYENYTGVVFGLSLKFKLKKDLF